MFCVNLLPTERKGILARGLGSMDRAQRGPHRNGRLRLELARLVSSLLLMALGPCLFLFASFRKQQKKESERVKVFLYKQL